MGSDSNERKRGNISLSIDRQMAPKPRGRCTVLGEVSSQTDSGPDLAAGDDILNGQRTLARSDYLLYLPTQTNGPTSVETICTYSTFFTEDGVPETAVLDRVGPATRCADPAPGIEVTEPLLAPPQQSRITRSLHTGGDGPRGSMGSDSNERKRGNISLSIDRQMAPKPRGRCTVFGTPPVPPGDFASKPWSCEKRKHGQVSRLELSSHGRTKPGDMLESRPGRMWRGARWRIAPEDQAVADRKP